VIDRYRLLRLYYLATPLFFLLDLVFQAPLRAAFLPRPEQRWAYYLFCLACGVAARARPVLTRPIAFVESCVSLFLLALSVLLPIWSLVDTLETASGPPPFGPVRLANFMLSAAVLLLAFYRNQPRQPGVPTPGS
jgi:hypothetical protein